jgi:hypothetical protein
VSKFYHGGGGGEKEKKRGRIFNHERTRKNTNKGKEKKNARRGAIFYAFQYSRPDPSLSASLDTPNIFLLVI